MQPIYQGIVHQPVLPTESGRTCYLLHHVLSRQECRRLMDATEERGYQPSGAAYPPSYRNNDRLVLDDATLAELLFERVQPHLPGHQLDQEGARWRLVGLNERFRCCRYLPGQSFRTHQDGAFHRTAEQRSRLTFMIYLNDADEFRGGTTRFFTSREPGAALLCSIRPRAGTLVVFDHDLWHDGEEVAEGVKYIARSDVMYALEQGRCCEADGEASVLRGHLGYVWAVLERSDGTLASASRDRTIRLWRRGPSGYRCEQSLTGHDGSVLALAEQEPGVLWSASRDRTLRMWARREGAKTRCVRTIAAHEGAVLALAALPGGLLASGSADRTIGLWGADGAHAGTLRGHLGWVWALAALQDETLASGSEDGTVRLWCPLRRSCLATLQGHQGAVMALVELAGNRLASGSADGTVRLWQRGPSGSGERTRCVAVLEGHTRSVCALAQVPGGILASGAEDDTIRLWRLHDGACVATLLHANFVRALVMLRDGTLASGSYDATIRFWKTWGR